MSRVAAMVREHDTRVWRIVEHHVHTARARQDFSDVARVGMDETSARKGQDYISLFADLDIGRVCFATEGRDADTVEEFAADLAAHGGDPKQVHTTSSDMSAAFITGIRQHLPNATMTFDRYHLAAKLSEAVDAVRRAEVATRPELKNTRWLWCKNWSNLSTGQRRELSRLLRPSAQLATGRALRWREDVLLIAGKLPLPTRCQPHTGMIPTLSAAQTIRRGTLLRYHGRVQKDPLPARIRTRCPRLAA